MVRRVQRQYRRPRRSARCWPTSTSEAEGGAQLPEELRKPPGELTPKKRSSQLLKIVENFLDRANTPRVDGPDRIPVIPPETGGRCAA